MRPDQDISKWTILFQTPNADPTRSKGTRFPPARPPPGFYPIIPDTDPGGLRSYYLSLLGNGGPHQEIPRSQSPPVCIHRLSQNTKSRRSRLGYGTPLPFLDSTSSCCALQGGKIGRRENAGAFARSVTYPADTSTGPPQ